MDKQEIIIYQSPWERDVKTFFYEHPLWVAGFFGFVLVFGISVIYLNEYSKHRRSRGRRW